MITLPTVEGGFRCVYADPAWHFKARTALQSQNPGSRRDAEKHYKTMSLEDIKAMPVSEAASKDAHLFLWVTAPNLAQGFEVLTAWGFRYSTIAFTWVKLRRSHNPRQLTVLPLDERDLHVGLGLTTRKNAEFVLLGRRGNARRIAKDVREVILAPVREHSRKPDQVPQRIERYCEGPYLELFARTQRPGWASWGNELDRFQPAAE